MGRTQTIKAICIKPTTRAKLLNIYEIAVFEVDVAHKEDFVIVHVDKGIVHDMDRKIFDRHFRIFDNNQEN